MVMPIPLQFLVKAGTVGAAVMAGSRIAAEGVHIVSGFVDEHLNLGLSRTIAGPLDMLTNVLDPLDITGVRKRKEQAAAAKSRKQKQRAARESKRRKQAEKNAAAAETTAATAEERAAQAEAKAAEMQARATTAEQQLAAERQKAKASRMGNWAKLARAGAGRAREASTQNPDIGAELAKMALEAAKNALNPPANAAAAFGPGMTTQAQSIAAAIVDEMNRRDGSADIEGLLDQMTQGDAMAAQMGLLGHAGIAGPDAPDTVAGFDDDDDDDVSGDDDDDVSGDDDDDVSGDDDDDDDDVSGADDDLFAVEGVVKKKRAQKGKKKPKAPENVIAGCCSACALGSTTCGKKGGVPLSMQDGSAIQGEDDDDDVSGDEYGDFELAGDDDDDDDDDSFSELVSGQVDGHSMAVSVSGVKR